MPDDRYRLPSFGEYYDHRLAIDAAINGRTPAQQLMTLVYAKLQERTQLINDRVAYAAAIRGITFEEMWILLLSPEYEKIQPNEITDIQPVQIPEWAKVSNGTKNDPLVQALKEIVDKENMSSPATEIDDSSDNT